MSFKKFAGIAILSGLALLIADTNQKTSNNVERNGKMKADIQKTEELNSENKDIYNLLDSNLEQGYFGINGPLLDSAAEINREYQRLIIASHLPDSIKNPMREFLKKDLLAIDSLKTIDESYVLENEYFTIKTMTDSLDSVIEETVRNDPEAMARLMFIFYNEQ